VVFPYFADLLSIASNTCQLGVQASWIIIDVQELWKPLYSEKSWKDMTAAERGKIDTLVNKMYNEAKAAKNAK
jgi:hypothetical protein